MSVQPLTTPLESCRPDLNTKKHIIVPVRTFTEPALCLPLGTANVGGVAA